MDKTFGIILLGFAVITVVFLYYQAPKFLPVLKNFPLPVFNPSTGSYASPTGGSGSGGGVKIAAAPTPTPKPKPTPTPLPQSIPAGFTINDLSPYFGKIVFGFVRPLPFIYTNSDYSEVRLESRLGTGEKVNITGWRVKGAQGSFLIPKATASYDVSLPFNSDNVVFSKDDFARIFSYQAFPDLDLRLNRCVGYIHQGFNPTLSSSCYPLDKNEIKKFSGQCQNYLNSLGSCALPSSNPPVQYNDTACYNFLSTINYSGCYTKHHKDQDFLLHEWRIWLSGSYPQQVNIFDPYHDRALLVDENGKLVDDYSY